jgi:hypothetical protein
VAISATLKLVIVGHGAQPTIGKGCMARMISGSLHPARWQAQALAWQAQPSAQPLAAQRLTIPVAVFGADERVALPANYRHPQERMGLLSTGARAWCAAFCVAPGHHRHGRALPVQDRGRARPADRRLLVCAQP